MIVFGIFSVSVCSPFSGLLISTIADCLKLCVHGAIDYLHQY